MPIYEYRCQDCGHELEVLQKVSDPPLKECPECHQESLQKLVSAAGFRLKGTGWYETDFKSKSEKKRNLAETDRGDSESKKKSDKADSTAKASDTKAAASG